MCQVFRVQDSGRNLNALLAELSVTSSDAAETHSVESDYFSIFPF